MNLSLFRKCPLCRKIKNYNIIDVKIIIDDVCSICLDDLNDNICKCNYCKNVFHIECIKQIKHNNSNNIEINNNIEDVPNNICNYLKICLCKLIHIIVYVIIFCLFVIAFIYSLSVFHFLY